MSNNLPWTYEQKMLSIPNDAVSAKVQVLMYRCQGKALLTNFSVEQVDSLANTTFSIKPSTNGTLELSWKLGNHGMNISRYVIYRDAGVLSALNDSNFLVTFPSQAAYGINIYESSFTDYFVQFNQVYTYQVLAMHSDGTVLDHTDLRTGEAFLQNNYQSISILLAFPRANGIHLSWRLKANSTARNITLYNGFDHISNLASGATQLIGTYPVGDMKAIVSSSYTGPFLLVSDDGNDVATVKLAYALNGAPTSPSDFSYKARNAALIYALTGNSTFLNITYASLIAGRINYTVYDDSSIKLMFATASMGRARAFDWAYDGFTSSI